MAQQECDRSGLIPIAVFGIVITLVLLLGGCGEPQSPEIAPKYEAKPSQDPEKPEISFAHAHNVFSEKGLCAFCLQDGINNTEVTKSDGASTSLQVKAYVDAEKKPHFHDPNSYLTNYTCSRNHSWHTKSFKKCWCGWPNVTEEKKLTENALPIDPEERNALADKVYREKLICVFCERNGVLTTNIKKVAGPATELAVVTYKDDKGKTHYHDKNSYVFHYQCERGHHWTVNESYKCWCHWPDNVNQSEGAE